MKRNLLTNRTNLTRPPRWYGSTVFCTIVATADVFDEAVLDLGVATISTRPAVGEILNSRGSNGGPLEVRFHVANQSNSQHARSAGEIIRYMEGTVPLWRDNDARLAPPLGKCPVLRAKNA
eukprot:scaffold2830_cov173-Amphora_coffeaeformis.AAC.1